MTAPTIEPVAPLQNAEVILETPAPQIQQTIEPEISLPIEQASAEIPAVQVAPQPEEAGQQDTQEVNPEVNLSLDSSLINTNISEPKVELPQIFMEENPTLATVVAPQAAEPSQNTVSQEPATSGSEPAHDFAEEIMPLQNNFDAQSQNQNSATEPEV